MCVCKSKWWMSGHHKHPIISSSESTFNVSINLCITLATEIGKNNTLVPRQEPAIPIVFRCMDCSNNIWQISQSYIGLLFPPIIGKLEGWTWSRIHLACRYQLAAVDSVSPIDADHLARDIGGCRQAEERHHGWYLVWLAYSAKWRPG